MGENKHPRILSVAGGSQTDGVDHAILGALAKGRNVPFPGAKDKAIIARLAEAGYEVVPARIAALGRAVEELTPMPGKVHLASTGGGWNLCLKRIYLRAGVEREEAT